MSKMASKTEVLRHKIAREVFGEVDDGDGIREIPSWEIFEKCLEQHKLIKELQHRLSNCIEPKFKTYQQVYTISKFYTSTNGIPEYEIFNSYYYVAENENEIIVGWNYKKDFNQRKYYYIRKDWVFATEEEARKKLEEIQNANN